MRYLLVCLMIPISGIAASGNSPLLFASGDERVALVELYTSEGCSSCPPADRWLSGLRDDPGLWSTFAPLAFHVDYWDYLGWRDRFASARYADRQRRYARSGNARTVYTPGFFVNGEEWRGWYGGRSLGPERPVVGTLEARVGDEAVMLVFTPAGAGAANDDAGLRATIAVLGMGIATDVAAGENAGRRLEHDIVVLGDAEGALHKAGPGFETTIALPAVDALARRLAIVAWISRRGEQQPLQAVGGYL